MKIAAIVTTGNTKYVLPLINCAINLILTWSVTLVVTLSAQDNAKLLQELKSGFKSTINWNKYQANTQTENQNLDYLNDSNL